MVGHLLVNKVECFLQQGSVSTTGSDDLASGLQAVNRVQNNMILSIDALIVTSNTDARVVPKFN